ncbi:hypothetical protein M514_27964 [Trichuris suis]|uniref:RNA-directed DNA polymerase n=1 Tax=Trichuris suis TaxID=68888 RepID=A0A085MRK5_9BILA|nr:hypothetical protein M514_27964 [Trichuris suis]
MKMGIGIRFSRGGWRIDRPDWVSQTAAEGKDSQPTGDVERAPASKPHMNLEEMRHRKKGSHNMIAGTLAEDETTQATSLEQLRFGEQLFMEEKECLVKLTNSFEQLFNRLPAGKGNSYAVKHRGIKGRYCTAYLDDILIHTPDFKQHVAKLEEVLGVLADHGLRLNPGKCVLGTHETEYLGHLIDSMGIRPDPAKTEAIATFLSPKSVRELRRFLGMTGYYRRFVANYADIAAPLYQLLNKNQKWLWTGKEEEAFQQLKLCLQQPPIGRHFQENWLVEVHCDGSRSGLGAVLLQKNLILATGCDDVFYMRAARAYGARLL